ncbi:hypothetical protein BUALT_Bualt19G0086900 [Buddleja alternifolia]|uniref:F-box associated beta-propeller type 1 domain-containing protein n=1 Tax=Buddleja alternifolia TaxID=168488 RepID=A0AAV6W0I3_9LAMI|nr:hypothetical protein BUALT_Bualt19G0086900 [Buddleja alternifolia]
MQSDHEYIRVPDSDRLRGATSSLWLGYSPNSSRKYKVLRIYTYPMFDHGIGAHIHDVGSSSWRDVASEPSDHVNWDNNYAFSLNGIKAYWVCRDFIVTFDFESEIFGEIDAPPALGRLLRFMSIGVVKDSLCLIGNDSNVVDIWMMKEGSGEWKKKYSCYDPVENPCPLCRPTKLRPLQELSTGEILMVSYDRRLVCYNTKKNRFRSIKLHMMKTNFSVVTFVPSFVSLKDLISLNESK